MLPTFGQEMSGDERDLRAMRDSFVLGLALVPLWSGEVLCLGFDYLLVLATVEMLELILFLSFFYSFLFNSLPNVSAAHRDS